MQAAIELDLNAVHKQESTPGENELDTPAQQKHIEQGTAQQVGVFSTAQMSILVGTNTLGLSVTHLNEVSQRTFHLSKM